VSRANESQADSSYALLRPDMVDRKGWGEPPSGVPAHAVRGNLAEGDTLQFRDLRVILNKMSAGRNIISDSTASEIPDTARITLRRYNTEEELTIAEGEALNWYGYHIGVLAVNTETEVLAGGLTELEIATVHSLPVGRAAVTETGGASQRLRVPHHIRDITLHHSGSSKPLTADEDPR